MSQQSSYRSAFVPHDLPNAIHGAQQGPLAGLTVVLKDMYAIVGQRTGGGNPDWLSSQLPAKEHAAVVLSLLDAGCRIVGKTICDEFFFSITGTNAHYGNPRNPKAPGRLAGGSSSGSASAVAAGVSDLGIGSDTGGSIRIPASFCGIYGIRTTHGRVDDRGMMPMSQSFDTPGWLAQIPGVFRKAGVLLDQRDVKARATRVLIAEDAFSQADSNISAFLLSALERMQKDLPPLHTAQISSEGFDGWSEIFRTMQGYEVWKNYGTFIREEKPTIGLGVRERIEYASRIGLNEYEAALRERRLIRRDLEKLVSPGIFLALPTAPGVAPCIDVADGDAAALLRKCIMRLTCVAGLGGLPQVSLPVGTVDGIPIGLSFIGWKGGDEALLDLAVKLAPHFGMAA